VSYLALSYPSCVIVFASWPAGVVGPPDPLGDVLVGGVVGEVVDIGGVAPVSGFGTGLIDVVGETDVVTGGDEGCLEAAADEAAAVGVNDWPPEPACCDEPLVAG
jgi:hypothetical protein